MPVRLLALDIDGTLLNSRGEMTPRVRASLEAARERGVRIALVTGRRFRSARPIAQELNCAVPLISHNGALTKNVTTLETIGYHPLDADMTREIIRIGRACGVDMICCDDPDDLGVMVLEGVSPDIGGFLITSISIAIRRSRWPTCLSTLITTRSRLCSRAAATRWTSSPLTCRRRWTAGFSFSKPATAGPT